MKPGFKIWLALAELNGGKFPNTKEPASVGYAAAFTEKECIERAATAQRVPGERVGDLKIVECFWSMHTGLDRPVIWGGPEYFEFAEHLAAWLARETGLANLKTTSQMDAEVVS